jgi:hypothetical protein
MKGYKAKAWREFARYIKLRDSIQTTGTKTDCICVTCGKRVSGSNLHAGHAIGGRGNSILLDPDIVHGQCSGCNITGNYGAYSIYMIKTYGLEMWEAMVARSKKPHPLKEFQWKELCAYWKEKADGLDSLMD